MRMLLMVAAAAFVSATILTGLLWRIAHRAGLMDVPNQRSSHDRPIARGGGAAIAIVGIAAMLLLPDVAGPSARFSLTMAVAGGGVALVGFIDDRRGVPWPVRLLVHVLAMGATLGQIIDVCPDGSCNDGTLGRVVLWFLLTGFGAWSLNAFNFMDGIDGLAASQTIFVSTAAAILIALREPLQPEVALLTVMAAAAAGFLAWNWPPARIFLGDVGSGFIGFILFVVPLAAFVQVGISAWVVIILSASFLTDATVTLVRRIARGEPWHQAHRSHAYQRLARYWSSHRRVTLAFTFVNVFWLLPLAWLATRFTAYASLICLLAVTPLAAAVWKLGGGMRGEIEKRVFG